MPNTRFGNWDIKFFLDICESNQKGNCLDTCFNIFCFFFTWTFFSKISVFQWTHCWLSIHANWNLSWLKYSWKHPLWYLQRILRILRGFTKNLWRFWFMIHKFMKNRSNGRPHCKFLLSNYCLTLQTLSIHQNKEKETFDFGKVGNSVLILSTICLISKWRNFKDFPVPLRFYVKSISVDWKCLKLSFWHI